MKRFQSLSFLVALLIFSFLAVFAIGAKKNEINVTPVNSEISYPNANVVIEDTARSAAFEASIKLEHQKDYVKAASALRDVHSENKSEYLVNLRLGWLNYLKGDYEKSKQHYTTAVKSSKKNIEARLGLTLPLSALNEWDAVREVYKQIIVIDPNHYTANMRLGQGYLFLQDYSTSKKYFEKILEMYPSDYDSMIGLAWVNFYQKNTEKAEFLFHSVLEISPKDSSATQGLQLLK